jgi:hypothetical protein
MLLDTAPLIPLTITASEYPINLIQNTQVEATQPQLPPSNALIKNNVLLPLNRAKNRKGGAHSSNTSRKKYHR